MAPLSSEIKKRTSNLLDSAPKQNVWAILLILLFVIHNIFALQHLSITDDEDKHLLYGVQILDGNSDRFSDSKMPVSVWNAIPQKIATYLPDGNVKDVLNELDSARAMTVLFSGGVAYVVFLFSRQMFGVVPAFFSLILYLIDPNLMAHSELVTTDAYALGMILISVYCLWRFANKRTWKNGLFCAMILGISQIVKYTSVVLFPIFLMILVIFDLPLILDLFHKKQLKKVLGWLFRYAVYIGVAGIITLLIINIGFLFNQYSRFGNYQFRSQMFLSLQEKFPSLNRVPVPIAHPYLEGLDWITENDRTGTGYGNLYLLGTTQKGERFPGYFLIASIFKVPLGIQALLVLAFLSYLKNKKKRKNFIANEMFLLIPVLFFVIYLNFFFNTQIGIRYYLVIFPLLYVFAGNLFTTWQDLSTGRKLSVLALFIYISISVFSYYPYYLSYFNELVWDRRTTYVYLADSNLDWSHEDIALNQYLSLHPDAIFNPKEIKPGLIIVSANRLVGVKGSSQDFAWLRENFKPVDMIAYGYFVYQISESEFDAFCVTTNYCE